MQPRAYVSRDQHMRVIARLGHDRPATAPTSRTGWEIHTVETGTEGWISRGPASGPRLSLPPDTDGCRRGKDLPRAPW
jgi:hypothetical protein